jgi:hypothetical protein
MAWKEVSAKRSQWSLDHQVARGLMQALLNVGPRPPPRGGGVVVAIFSQLSVTAPAYLFATLAEFFTSLAKVAKPQPLMFPQGSLIFFQAASGRGDIRPFADMHSQSGRLPTIFTQRPRIKGMATFGVRVAILAVTASWGSRKSIAGGSIYLVLVSIYFRCLDAGTFSPHRAASRRQDHAGQPLAPLINAVLTVQ